jgi:hypothetical protein
MLGLRHERPSRRAPKKGYDVAPSHLVAVAVMNDTRRAQPNKRLIPQMIGLQFNHE